jgi:uncharacterized membrane protein YccC
MGKRLSMLGWLVFIAAIIGAIFRTGPDDPITASLKALGDYQPTMTILGVLIGVAILWLIWEIRKTVKLARKLEQVKRKRMQ